MTTWAREEMEMETADLGDRGWTGGLASCRASWATTRSLASRPPAADGPRRWRPAAFSTTPSRASRRCSSRTAMPRWRAWRPARWCWSRRTPPRTTRRPAWGRRAWGPSRTCASTRGLHLSVAFTPQRVCLGVLRAVHWARDAPCPRAERRHLGVDEKESRHWVDGYQDCCAVQGQLPDTLVVSLADREGDIYEWFAGYADHAPRPPPSRAGYRLPAMEVNAVLAREESPPPGGEALEWLLLTGLPVASHRQASLVVAWYAVRWCIAVYFHVLKSGCQQKRLHLETDARLLPCLALYMVAAWRVLFALMLGRGCPDASCETVFDPQGVEGGLHRGQALPAPGRAAAARRGRRLGGEPWRLLGAQARRASRPQGHVDRLAALARFYPIPRR
jgi:hypothetical protein